MAEKSLWDSIEEMPEFAEKTPEEKLGYASYFLQKQAENLAPDLAGNPDAQTYFRDRSKEFLFGIADRHFPSAIESAPSQIGESLAREDRALSVEGARLNTEIGKQAAATLAGLEGKPNDEILKGDPNTFKTVSPNSDTPVGEYRKYLQSVVEAQSTKGGKKAEDLVQSFEESAKRTPSAAMLKLQLSEGWAGWDELIAKSKDPFDTAVAAIMGTMLESGVQSAKGAVAGAAATAATGNPLVGGAVMGGVAGESEFQATYLGELQEELKKRGKADAATIQEVLKDEEFNARVDKKAMTRGVAIGATEAVAGTLSFGIANKIGTTTAKKALLGVGAEAGIGAVGGSGGEFLARLFSGEDIWTPEARKDIASEGIAEVSQAGTGTATVLFDQLTGKNAETAQPEVTPNNEEETLQTEAPTQVNDPVATAPFPDVDDAPVRSVLDEFDTEDAPAEVQPAENAPIESAPVNEEVNTPDVVDVDPDTMRTVAREMADEAISEVENAPEVSLRRQHADNLRNAEIPMPDLADALDAQTEEMMIGVADEKIAALEGEISALVQEDGETAQSPANPAEVSSNPVANEATIQESLTVQEPSTVRSFDFDEGRLRVEIRQNEDGTAFVEKTNPVTGAKIPLEGADSFADIPSAVDFVKTTFNQGRDAEVTAEAVAQEPGILGRGEQDRLMQLLQTEKMQPSQTDIRTIGRVARKEAKGFRGLESDTSARGQYRGAPLVGEYQGNPAAQERIRGIYSRESGNRPDQLADMAWREGLIPDPTAESLFQAIRERLDGDAGRVSQVRQSDAEIADVVANRASQVESDAEGFYSGIKSQYRRGGVVPARNLQIGDRLQVGDDTVEVTEANEEGVILQSARFGVYPVSLDETIGFDEVLAEGGIPVVEREGTLPTQVVTREETDELTNAVRSALANSRRGYKWGGRVLSSNEHSALSRSRSELEAARRIADFIGRRLVGVTDDFPANGAVLPGDSDLAVRHIFINANSSRPEILIASHELLHSLRKSDQDLYQELADFVDADAITKYLNETRPEFVTANMTQDEIKEEYLADYLSEMMGRQSFWEDLASRDASLFERFADYVIAFLRQIRDRIAGDKIKVEKYLSDQAAMRDKLLEVMVAFKARQAQFNAGILDGPLEESMPFADQRFTASDSSYLSAVESGDMETAQRMVDEAARAAGYLDRLLHGSTGKNWTVYDLKKAGSAIDSGFLGRGIYLTDNRGLAERHSKLGATEGRVLELFAKLENPFQWGKKTLGARGIFKGERLPESIHDEVMAMASGRAKARDSETKGNGWTSVGANPDAILEDEISKAITEVLTAKGFDGVISTVGENLEVVAFNPNQIKSADPITRDESGNVIPLSQRFNPARDDIRFADRKTKPNQQGFGQWIDREDEIQGMDEVRAAVKPYFDGDQPVSFWSKQDAFNVLSDLDDGRIDAAADTGFDAANQVLKGELWKFALKVTREEGDSSFQAQMQDRLNDYFDRESTKAGRALNALSWYLRHLDQTLSEVLKGKRAKVNEMAPVVNGQVVDLAADLERLQKENQSLRLQVEDFSAAEIAENVASVDGKRTRATDSSVERMAKTLAGGKKAGDRIKKRAQYVEDVVAGLRVKGEIKFSDSTISNEEADISLQIIVREQLTKTKKRRRENFLYNLKKLGVDQAKAEKLFAWAAEQRALAEEDAKADAADASQKGTVEKSAAEKTVENLDKESRDLDRLNRKVDKMAERTDPKTPKRTKKEREKEPWEKIVDEALADGANFDREKTIKALLREEVRSETAVKMADAILAKINNRQAKQKGAKTPADEAKGIIDRFRNPVETERRAKSPIKKLVNESLLKDSKMTEAEFLARAKAIGVPQAESTDLWGEVSRLRELRQELRSQIEEQRAAEMADKEAQALISSLAASQSDTQDNGTQEVRENAIRAIYQDYVSHGASGERTGPAMSKPAFVRALLDEGVSQAEADSLANLATREKQNRLETAKGKASVNAVERSVPFIMREILAHPYLRLVGPEERVRMMAKVFEDRAGLTPVDARVAAAKFESQLVKKWDEAAQRLADEYAAKRNAPGFRREPGSAPANPNKKTPFDKIREAIRAGAYDPRKRILDEVAKSNGWTDLTELELQRLAELDASLDAENLTWFEEVRIKREMARTIHKSALPAELKKTVREYYLANIFSGVKTWVLQASVLFNNIANLGLRDPAAAIVGSIKGSEVSNLVGYTQAIRGIGSQLRNAIADGVVTFRTGDVRGVQEEEILNAISGLEQVHDRNLEIWNNPNSTAAQKTAAATKIFFASNRFFFRILGAFDGFFQGFIRTYTNELELFSKASGMGLTRTQIQKLTGENILLTEQFAEQADAKGLKGADKMAYVNDRITMSMYDAFEGAGVSREFINESRARAFREAALETGVNAIETGGLSKTGEFAEMMQKWAAKGGFFGFLGTMLVPVVRTPFNVFHRSAWWSPYGIARLLYVAKKTKGFTAWKDGDTALSPYENSLADPQQLARRMAETALGTSAFVILAAMAAKEDEKEEDEKLFRINLSGPSTANRAEYTAWRATDRRPFTIQIRGSAADNWSTVGFRKGGMEFFNFAATLVGAWDQRKYSRGAATENEVANYAATLGTEMAGESFFFIRPFTSRYSLADTDAMGSQLGFMLSGFVPGASMLKTPNRFRDFQEYDGFGTSFWMQMPVVPMLREDTPALNSLGDPLGSAERERSYMGATFGMPVGYVPFKQRATTGAAVQGEDIYRLLFEKDYFPSVKARSDFEADIPISAYRKFVQQRGSRIKDYVKRNYESLMSMDADKFKEAIQAEATKATNAIQKEMRLK